MHTKRFSDSTREGFMNEMWLQEYILIKVTHTANIAASVRVSEILTARSGVN